MRVALVVDLRAVRPRGERGDGVYFLRQDEGRWSYTAWHFWPVKPAGPLASAGQAYY